MALSLILTLKLTLTLILTLFSCFMLFRAPSSDLQSSQYLLKLSHSGVHQGSVLSQTLFAVYLRCCKCNEYGHRLLHRFQSLRFSLVFLLTRECWDHCVWRQSVGWTRRWTVYLWHRPTGLSCIDFSGCRSPTSRYGQQTDFNLWRSWFGRWLPSAGCFLASRTQAGQTPTPTDNVRVVEVVNFFRLSSIHQPT